MKKTLMTLVLVITTLMMTSCDETFFTGGENKKPDKNFYCIDSTYQSIKSCVSYASEEETTLVFTCDDLSVVQFTLNNHSEIPVGTFELTNDDECNYEGSFESIDLSGDLEGVLSVSLSEAIYTFTFEGNIVDDTVHTAFSLSYQDEVVDANADTGNGTLTINDSEYSLKKGVCTNQSYEGLNLYAMVLTSSEKETENYCVVTLGFLGKKDIPTGTYPIAEIPMMGPLFMVEANGDELIGATGEVTITKNEESYSINANGTFKQVSEEGIEAEQTSFTLSYEGTFIEMK